MDAHTIYTTEILPHASRMRARAISLMRDVDLAEDVLQDALLRAWRGLHGYTPGTNAAGWLYMIVQNCAYSAQRQAQRQVRIAAAVVDAELLRGPGVTPERDIVDRQLSPEVKQAIMAVPEVFRGALVLADIEGLKYKHISHILGCPVGTVMSRLYRGRKMLRDALEDHARARGIIKPVKTSDEPVKTPRRRATVVRRRR